MNCEKILVLPECFERMLSTSLCAGLAVNSSRVKHRLNISMEELQKNCEIEI